MIELYLLEQLDKFATCGTLSEAAEQLHITQPTLTRSMKKIEEYFGFPLFIRKKKRITLNETGKLLAEYAKKILDEEENMEIQVRKFQQSQNTVNVASIASGPLFHFLPAATALFPNATIASTVDTEEAILRGLFTNEYQIIFLTHPVNEPGYVSKSYISEQLCAFVSPNHPFASKKSIKLEDMNGESFFIFAESPIWQDVISKYMPASAIHKQETVDAMYTIIRQTDLSTFSTNLSQTYLPTISSNRVRIPFTDQDSNVTYYLICNKDNFDHIQKLHTLN